METSMNAVLAQALMDERRRESNRAYRPVRHGGAGRRFLRRRSDPRR